jgi:hypothetical protein
VGKYLTFSTEVFVWVFEEHILSLLACCASASAFFVFCKSLAMPLSEEDLKSLKDSMGSLLDSKIDKFTNAATNMEKTIERMGKRIQRLEYGFTLLANAARKTVTEEARANHDRLLRWTFDRSDLLVLPPLEEAQDGKLSRRSLKCSLQDVSDLISAQVKAEFAFEVEPAKPSGYRVLISSRSPQTRRRCAATIIRDCKEELSKRLGMHLQYDKPYELRAIQRPAHQFLSVLKKHGGDTVRTKELKKGYLVVNGHRLAPEYLVPSNGHWDRLAGMVVTKLRGLRGPNVLVPEDGLLYDVFGAAYAADRGVFDLHDLQLEEDDGDGDDTRMF